MDTSTFSKPQLAALTRPCVYLFLRKGKPLYIGASKNGFFRFADGDCTNEYERGDAFNLADEIKVHWFPTYKAALLAEKQMIVEHQPKHNTKHTRRMYGLTRRILL